MRTEIITAGLIGAVRSQYALPWRGIHGVTHWARVLENGLRLAPRTGANIKVVQLFAIFHDARRVNEGDDPQHGRRGAEFAAALRGRLLHLSNAEFQLLYTACEHHTEGKSHHDVTVQTCWDADRLDLGRVAIEPEPVYLCTKAAKAKETIEWAYQRGCAHYVSPLVDGWEKAGTEHDGFYVPYGT